MLTAFRTLISGRGALKWCFWGLCVGLLATTVACQRVGQDLQPEDLKPGEVMVVSTRPDADDLPLTGSITLQFSSSVVPDSLADGRHLERAPAKISPQVPGYWKWTSTDALVFVPGEHFEPNSELSISLDSGFFKGRDLRLRGQKKFSFVVQPFRLEWMSLNRERVPDQPRTYIILGTASFNYPVEPADLGAALDVTLDSGDQVEFTLQSTATQTLLYFQAGPLEAEDRDTELAVVLAGELKSAMGGIPLGEDVERRVVIPAIERLEIRNLRTQSRQDKAVVLIDFSAGVDPTDLEAALEIEPAVEDLRLVGNWRTMELLGQWQIGQKYRIRIDGQLAGEGGLLLERDYQGTVYVKDLDPWVSIAGQGSYLSLRGEQKLAVNTLNVDQLTVSVDRIFANNLVPFLQDGRMRGSARSDWRWRSEGLNKLGRNLYLRDLDVADPVHNKTVVTPVDLSRALDNGAQGIFRVSVWPKDRTRDEDARWVVATDLGLVAKRSGDDLMIAVASIKDLTPQSGVTVKVLSHNNQTLATGRTDAQGFVQLKGLNQHDGDRPFVVVATKGQDLSFLALDETMIPMGDLDVGGVHLPLTGYRAFMYGDRDIYRPGDTAHLAWLVRDSKLQPSGGFPLTLLIRGPQGREFAKVRVQCDAAGSGGHTLELPRWVQTGRYQVTLSVDERTVIGRTSWSVEDFIPDRMKVKATLTGSGPREHLVAPTDSLVLDLEAMTLYGPPAVDRLADASIWFERAQAQFESWPDFTFGDPDQQTVPARQDLGQTTTDNAGQAHWSIDLPTPTDYQGWLRLHAGVKVAETGGGRVVRDNAQIVYSPVSRLMGLQNLSQAQSDVVLPGQDINFAAVLVDLDGHVQASSDVRLRVYRKRWQTVLRRTDNGRFRYVSEYDERLVEDRILDLQATATPVVVNVARNGSYRLVLETADGQTRGALPFYVYGAGYTPWAMSNPETVNLKLDQETYNPGDVITASVEAPFAGLLLLTVEREQVYHRQWVRLDSNTATVQVRLPANSLPNTYLVATLLRPLSDLDSRAPARAFGAAPVFQDRSSVTLPIDVSTVPEMRPRNMLQVAVRLPDLKPGTEARVTLAAVDEGILQLTKFRTPSPLDFFLQRRRLSVESFDIWSLLLPEYERVKRQSSPGGGALAEMAMRDSESGKRLNPLAVDRVKPVALWSGILKGQKDWQTVDFQIPEFNGTLRVMAVAAAGDRFGSTETPVQVADPFVLSPSLPRFLAPMDSLRVPVPVYNGATKDDQSPVPIDVSVDLDGPVALAEGQTAVVQLSINGGDEGVAWFRLVATDEVGPATIKFTATGAGESVSVNTDLPVRAPWPLQSQVTTGVVKQDTPAKVTLTDQWFDGTDWATITVAANPLAQFGAALPYLLKYPYGCLEQKTSRSFPLLYFGDLAAELAPDSFSDGDADYYINSGLDYVISLQRPGAGFSMWPGNRHTNPNYWASTYVTHFLVEAQRKGFVVPERAVSQALDYVAGLARSSRHGWNDVWPQDSRLRTRAYACYVLAMAGRPERGAMDQLAQDHWLDLPLSARTHLAGAFALAGNQARFEQMLPVAGAPAVQTGRDSGFTWYSATRDDAVRLDVLATVAPEHPQVPVLVQSLARRARNGRWHNTQENAFALLALGKLAAAGLATPAPGEIHVGGQQVESFTSEGVSITSDSWQGQDVTITATGPGTAWYTVLDEGVPRTGAETDFDAGLRVRREYMDETGQRLNLDEVRQGQTVICQLSLASTRGRVRDVVISDLVPAGLEIENPRLVEDGGLDGFDPVDRQQRMLDRDHLEIRDDRLLLFTRADTRVAVFYYGLRAVTTGHFVLPPVRAEAMYDPEVRSVGGATEVHIVAP